MRDLLGECLGSGEQPCGLLNVGNHFSRLLQEEDDAVIEQFARETQRGRLIVSADPSELLQAMADYRAPETRRGTAS